MSRTEAKSLFVFLDEGGNLDFSELGTRFFVLSSITRERSAQIHLRLAELKYELTESGLDIEYFHASEDRQAVRDCVFGAIRLDLSALAIDSLIVAKQETEAALRDAGRLYLWMIGHLVQKVVKATDMTRYANTSS